MGAGVSCCGGKATDIVESTNPPLERRSIGVGDGKQTAETGTGNDEEESSQDSGRVSPTPSTVTIDSVYTLEEGDRYTKTPEPNRASDVNNDINNTSDYDSSASNGISGKRSLRRRKKTPAATTVTASSRAPLTHSHLSNRGNQRDSPIYTGGSYTDDFARGLRSYPTQPNTSTRRNTPLNVPNNSTQRNRDYLNPGYIGSIGSHKDANGTFDPGNRKPGNQVHTLDNLNNNPKDSSRHQDRKQWGPGYRLGGSDVNNSSSERSRHSPGSYVPSAVSSAGTSRSMNQRSDGQYILDSTSSANNATPSGFTGRPPLASRGSLSRSNADSSNNTNLSVEGRAMNVHGQRRNNENNRQDGNRNVPPPKSEAFYLPMDALVATKGDQRNKKRNNKKKKKQRNDAFMITFDGDNASTLPLNGDQEETGSSSDGDEIHTSNQSSRNHSGFGDYSYNLSRSNSRSTTVSDIHENHQSPFDSTQRAFNDYKNNRHNPNKIKPSAAITGSSRGAFTNKPSTSHSGDRPSYVKQGTVKAWKNNKEKAGIRKRNNPKTEIDALNEHINDLRQLLSLHMQHQQPSNNPISQSNPTSSTTQTSQQPSTSNNNDTDLIEKLQAEIVELENKLCEKEDRIAELLSEHQNDNEHDIMYSDAGIQAGQQTSDTGTDVQEEIDDLEENYEMMLSDLDKNAVKRLNNAKNAALSEEELNNILSEHVKNRDLLRNNMLQEKRKLNERLQEKLERRKNIDIDSEVEKSHDDSIINNSITDNKKVIKHKPPVPAYPSQDMSNEYGASNSWKPGLTSIGEDEEKRAGKSQRIRSNTFTKDDEGEEISVEGVESQNNNGANNHRNGTFTKEEQSFENINDKKNSSKKIAVNQSGTSHQNYETQTDIGGDLNESLQFQKKEKSVSSTANTNNSTTEFGISAQVETSNAETCTDPTLFELQRLTTDIRNTIESIPRKLQENDDKFLENFRKNCDKMSAEEMQELLKQHVENQERFEALEIANIQRQHKALQEKLNQRRKARNEQGEEAYDSDDDDLEDLVESMNESVSELKQKRDQQTQFSLHGMPTSEDEIALLLSKHRRQNEELRQKILNGKLKHIENLQKKMLLRKQTRAHGNNSTDQSVGTQAEQEYQQKGTQAMLQHKEGISIETNTDPVPTRRKTVRDSDNLDVSGVLKEHKDRVQELRQIKQDYGRVHQEKVQERLAKRLKKNGDQAKYDVTTEE